MESGLDTFGEYLEWAIMNKIVDKAGSWYSYGKEKIGQGVENVITYFKANPELFDTIKSKVDEINKFAPMEKIGEMVSSDGTVEKPKERKTRKSAVPESMELPIEGGMTDEVPTN